MKKIKNLVIIPARGGSKRIPRKNIKDFLGVPIIGYSIKAALDSQMFDEVIVSTDDPEIAKVAKDLGGHVPFYRSAKNSDDYSTLSDVLIEVIEEYRNNDVEVDNVCCILPTAPFLNGSKLIQSFHKFIENDFDSVFPVLEFSYPIQRSLVKTDRGLLKMSQPEYLNTRSQDLEKHYHDVGQFYWIKSKCLIKERSLMTNNTGMIEMSPLEVQDIDTPEDWINAELKYQILNA